MYHPHYESLSDYSPNKLLLYCVTFHYGLLDFLCFLSSESPHFTHAKHGKKLLLVHLIFETCLFILFSCITSLFLKKAVVSPHNTSIVLNHLIYALITLFNCVTFFRSFRITTFYVTINCSIASLFSDPFGSPHFMSVYMWGPVLMSEGVILAAKN